MPHANPQSLTAAFAPAPGELILLLLFEHGKAPDVLKITSTMSVSGKRRLCASCEARELSLNAHISRSVVENWTQSSPFETRADDQMIAAARGGAIKLGFRTLN